MASEIQSCDWNGSASKLTGDGANGSADRREPVVAIWLRAAGDGKKLFLQLPSDRARNTFANLNVVHGTDGRDFHSGAHKENFIGNVKHFARNDAFFARNLKIFGNLHDGVARNARKYARGQRRRVECPIVSQENV